MTSQKGPLPGSEWNEPNWQRREGTRGHSAFSFLSRSPPPPPTFVLPFLLFLLTSPPRGFLFIHFYRRAETATLSCEGGARGGEVEGLCVFFSGGGFSSSKHLSSLTPFVRVPPPTRTPPPHANGSHSCWFGFCCLVVFVLFCVFPLGGRERRIVWSRFTGCHSCFPSAVFSTACKLLWSNTRRSRLVLLSLLAIALALAPPCLFCFSTAFAKLSS